MLDNYPSLLITKLHTPRVRSSNVSRDRLLSALNSGLDRKLILIAAAAGFGKTSLLAEWSEQHTEHVAWLSLDEGDNDPVRFLSYLIASIQMRRPTFAIELLAALQAAQPPPIDHAVRTFINQLAAEPDRLIIVLDDYHVIGNQDVHRALSFMLDHLSAQVTLVLLTRADPPVPLAKLRARNDLLELRAADLRFSIEEAAEFLKRALHIDLPLDQIRALEDRTEGWIAGLQLASIALHSQSGERETFIRNFTGNNRFVLDYLIEEVLAHQPENVRKFLLRTSILQRLNGSLVSAVTGEADGQALIDQLEKNNLFIIPLDDARQWYRYHHLFADLLTARLQTEEPSVLRDLRQRAAHWHAENNLPEEAVTYALAAHDFDFAAQLLNGPAGGVIDRGEMLTLLNWYKTFPAEFVAQHPQLCMQFGMAFAFNGRITEAATLLDYLQRDRSIDDLPGEALMLAFVVASYRQDQEQLTKIIQSAIASTQTGGRAKLTQAMIVSASGEHRRAVQLMAEAQSISERDGDRTLALTALIHQCRLHVYLGNFQQAHELCAQALEQIRSLGSAALPMAGMIHSSLGRILIEWNELDQAKQHLHEAIRISEASGLVAGMVSSATVMLAEVNQAQGNTAEALEIADRALAIADRNDPPAEAFWLRTYQVRLQLLQGNTAAPSDWLRATMNHQQPPSLFYPNTILPLTQARVLLTQRKFEEAASILINLLRLPHDLLTIEMLLTLATVRQAQGDSVHAEITFKQAVLLAARENRVRVFLDLGGPLIKLLARFVEANPKDSFAARIQSALPQTEAGRESIESFSDREIEVMKLIVAGYSNDEIAKQLVIAVSTVKWYVNTLYGKLHVKSRSQAIAKVRELKLI